ncbi:MlaA family lipoprotein [Desulfovibrio litoralis]|uniref:Phospholipid-binding lipoprotein MlaA n=1 Tax=Desulfovibrio litoralis DSM 11393 TaxID=1121455 RepID=A0A1M7S6W8_9BACT|nr:VacJ family lipoprotein [Desulfovibrio litoralis]SHN54105.1 phospholipid-binding lipoprotein MlaA [Desulfovibrio litoralis DSM 11393]
MQSYNLKKLRLKNLSLTVLLIVITLLSACASKNNQPELMDKDSKPLRASPQLNESDESDIETGIPDPIYPWNRFWFEFNSYAVDYVVRPVYKTYDFITPDPVQTSVGNFFHNILFPVRFVNSLLQFKFKQAGVEMSRFVLNTTYGVGGLFDPAADKKAIVETDDEDFGQTLGNWGVGEGFYIVWPLLGPSTPRDTVGKVGDFFLDPVNYVDPWELRTGANVLKNVNNSGEIIKQFDTLNEMSVDPYSAMRNAYIQRRRAQIAK